MPNQKPDWTEAEDAVLRENWGTLSGGKIAALLGRRSKDATIGRAHRLGLAPLPSPIKRVEGAAPKPRPVPVTGPTLPPLASVVATIVRPYTPGKRQAPLPKEVSAPVFQVAPVVAPPPAASRRRADCCWPIGEPGSRSFRYCDAPADPGRPYCAEHVRVAYVPGSRQRLEKLADAV